mmetsp:Transcript_52537/g.102770  ORF Transcript_52537/g.102770 Transcript_52537/m.102770 type:complete len:125 (+) Transcript_52537:93-467(+)
MTFLLQLIYTVTWFVAAGMQVSVVEGGKRPWKREPRKRTERNQGERASRLSESTKEYMKLTKRYAGNRQMGGKRGEQQCGQRSGNGLMIEDVSARWCLLVFRFNAHFFLRVCNSAMKGNFAKTA